MGDYVRLIKHAMAMNNARHFRPTHLLVQLVMLLFVLGSLTACQRDDVVAPSSSGNGQVDDHGGHGNDDPPGDDNGGGN